MESNLPITDPKEVQAFAKGLPFAMDSDFIGFVLGFPHKYLASTPRAEVVKHYGLMRMLGSKPVVSSLAREGALWKLSLVARDRRALFSRIAGALSCYGMNIVGAEAFANANALVLDTFRFADSEAVFEKDGQRRSFQGLLEDAVQGKLDLEPRLKARLEQTPASAGEALDVELRVDPVLPLTRLTLDCRDHFGLLYLVTRCLAEEDCSIELAYIETAGGRVRDEFFVSRDGRPLDAAGEERVRQAVARLGQRYFGQDPALLKGA